MFSVSTSLDNRVLSHSRRITSLPLRLRNRHFLILDAAALVLIPTAALLLQLELLSALRAYAGALAIYTSISLIVRLAIYSRSGLYNRYWRAASVVEMRQIATAWLSATACICVPFYIASTLRSSHGTPFLPASLPLVDALLAIGAVGGVRFATRLSSSSTKQMSHNFGRRVLVIGAGNAGVRIVQDIKSQPELELTPIGYIDDNPQLRGLMICGIPVLGDRSDFHAVVRDQQIDQVVIAIPSAPGREIRSYITLCKEATVAARTLPSMTAILEDRVSVSELRNVAIDDLLRRAPIRTDVSAVRQLMSGKRILVTGAGGSIGSELCRQVLRSLPSEIAIVGHGENSIFDINNELEQIKSGGIQQLTMIRPYIADIRDSRRLETILREFKPDVVFHAAAHKHVPLMELNPCEAIANNVLGTHNLLRAAIATGVEHFVLISTDKAVNPTSVMGASKRVSELLVLQAAQETGLPYVAVRFGNVLGSRGSVVPTFKRQIATGGPVTVSNPEMTRFFISIPEAVQLLLQAAVLGKGGEVFMLDMGSPVKITELARDMIRLSGLAEDEIDIVYSGIRPGEKLFEELFVPGERYQQTPHDKILIAASASCTIPGELLEKVAAIEHLLEAGSADRKSVIGWLSDLIPEFQPDEFRRSNARSNVGLDAVCTAPSLAVCATVRTQDRREPVPGGSHTSQ